MRIPMSQISGQTASLLQQVQAQPGGMSFYQATSGKGGAIFGILVALAGFAGLIFFALEERADDDIKILYLIASAICGLILIASVKHIAKYNAAPIKPFRAMNPLYFVDVGWKELQVYKMWTLGDWKATHHHQNGAYQFTAFEMPFDDGRVTFNVTPKNRAEQLFEEIKRTRLGFLEASQGGAAAENLVRHDIFGLLGKKVELADPTAPAPAGSMSWLTTLVGAGVIGAAGYVGLAYISAVAYDERDWGYLGDIAWAIENHLRDGAVCSHQDALPGRMVDMIVASGVGYYSGSTLLPTDEQQRDEFFDEIEEAVQAYNDYFGTSLKREDVLLPAARRRFEADWTRISGSLTGQQIVNHKSEMAEFSAVASKTWNLQLKLADVAPHIEKIDVAVGDYIRKAIATYRQRAEQGGASEEAMACITKIMEAMIAQKRYSLIVGYEQALESDTSLEATFKENYPTYQNIAPMSPDFTTEKNAARETMITEALRSAFEELCEGLVTVTRTKSEDAAAYLDLSYEIKPHPDMILYYQTTTQNGIELPPDPPEIRQWYTGIYSSWNLRFRLEGSEAQFYAFDTEAWPADEFSIPYGSTMYEAMAQSLFQSFRRTLTQHFGIS